MGFRYFLYNPETGEILSRTPISWAKIIIFYCIYYTCLGLSSTITPKIILAAYYSWIKFFFPAAFWIGCLHIFFLTVPEAHPRFLKSSEEEKNDIGFLLVSLFDFRWTLDASIIGSNPGFWQRTFCKEVNIGNRLKCPVKRFTEDKKETRLFQASDFDRVLLMNVLTPPCLRLRYLSPISSPLILMIHYSLHWGRCGFLEESTLIGLQYMWVCWRKLSSIPC